MTTKLYLEAARRFERLAAYHGSEALLAHPVTAIGHTLAANECSADAAYARAMATELESARVEILAREGAILADIRDAVAAQFLATLPLDGDL